MSNNPIQPTAMQAAYMEAHFEQMLSVLDSNPIHLSNTLTKLLRCYVATIPHDSLEVISAVGEMQSFLVSSANSYDLFDFGLLFFQNMPEVQKEKEGVPC